ncbi:conjugal transfer protein TraF [Hylemonella sp. W303a]|uniref:conjugal transfer protein TraF n=1 Tax=Hylemonella sp. W303a TaxID=3389873 RepID=UPI00396B23D7
MNPMIKLKHAFAAATLLAGGHALAAEPVASQVGAVDASGNACKGWLACGPATSTSAAPEPKTVKTAAQTSACKGWLACGQSDADVSAFSDPQADQGRSPHPVEKSGPPGILLAQLAAPKAQESAVPGVAAKPSPMPEAAVKTVDGGERPSPVSGPLVSPFGQASSRNPAAPAAVLKQGRGGQFRLGLVSFGVGYEIGALNNIDDQIDDASDRLERFTITESELTSQLSGNSSQAAAEAALKNYVANRVNDEVIDVVNPVLSSLRREGRVTVMGEAQVPLTPLVVAVEAWGGSLLLDASFQALADTSVVTKTLPALDANAITVHATFVGPGPDAAIGTSDDVYEATADFNYDDATANESSVLVKAALVQQYGLGYSHNVWKSALPVESWGSGWLTVGGRVKYYQVKLVRAAVRLKDNDDAEDTLKDAESKDSTGVGVDLGAQWSSRYYRAGVWGNNLNSPQFKFNKLDLTSYTDATIKKDLQAGATYTMKPQVQVETAVHTENQQWVLGLNYDANSVRDPLDREFQWLAVNAAHVTNTFWIPGFRVGYRENLVGTQLSYATAGLTWFGVNLDLAYGLDTIKYDGDTYPRSVMLNISSSMTF